MSKLIVLNPFTLDVDAHSKQHGIEFLDDSLTTQADAQSADINYIVKQFGLTHQLPYGLAVPSYDDFTDAPADYHTAMNLINAANDVFMELEAPVRARFNHDAGAFMDFFNNPSNYDEAVSLGLVVPKASGSAEPNASSGSAEPDANKP